MLMHVSSLIQLCVSGHSSSRTKGLLGLNILNIIMTSESQMPDVEEVDEAQFDKYLQTEVILPDGETLVQGS